MQRIQILGVPVDPMTVEGVLPHLQGFLTDGEQHHIMTPNSEMLVMASRDEEFRTILIHSALNLPDSAGLLWAAKWTGQELPHRVTGIDTISRLCTEITEEHPLFLLGAREGVAEKAARELQKQNPRLRIVGTFAGSPFSKNDEEIREKINASGARIVFVAYGAPRQDKWIARNLPHLHQVRLAVGVGGSFDFLAGIHTRAPLWMQQSSLEWLWRLMQQPQRIGRIFNAVVVFPLLVLIYGKKAPRL